MELSKRTTIIVIVVMFLMVIGIGLSSSFPYRHYVEYEFSLEIKSQGNFSVRVPFPLGKEGGFLEPLYDSIKIESGSGTFSLDQTEKGLSLLAVGKGSILFKGSFKREGSYYDKGNYEKLSLTNYSSMEGTVGGDQRMISSFNSVGNARVNWSFDYYDGYNKGIFNVFWGDFGEWGYVGDLSPGWNECVITGKDLMA